MKMIESLNSTDRHDMIFPDIFITGQLPKNWTKRSIVADGLIGWANCMLGSKPPKKFGEGMVLISQKLGIPATEDNLDKLAHEFLKLDQS